MCAIITRKIKPQDMFGKASFIVEKDGYYLTLLRYIEANALRAALSKTAQDWQYGSLAERVFNNRILLHKPYAQLDDWMTYVNTPQSQSEIDKIRDSVNRQAPLGGENWAAKIAKKYGLLSTLNAIGRVKNDDKSSLSLFLLLFLQASC